MCGCKELREWRMRSTEISFSLRYSWTLQPKYLILIKQGKTCMSIVDKVTTFVFNSNGIVGARQHSIRLPSSPSQAGEHRDGFINVFITSDHLRYSRPIFSPMNFIFHHVHKMPCQAFQQIGSKIFSRFFNTNKRYIYIKGNKFKNVHIFSKACIDRQ